MVPLVVLLFVVVPIAELAVIVRVAGTIGVAETLLVLVAVSVVGAWLVKREGLSVLRRVQHALEVGQLPHRELLDGLLILFAGALMLTPGFLTDVLGLALLFPPTRAAVRAVLYRRFRANLVVSFGRRAGVHDTEGWERTGPPPSRPELDG